MPTITVDRTEFFTRLGREYTFKDFDELLFEYGLELDEDTTTDPKHPAGEPHQMKIEVPANRYDLLCIEGIVRALKLYLNPEIGVPSFTLKPAPEVSKGAARDGCLDETLMGAPYRDKSGPSRSYQSVEPVRIIYPSASPCGARTIYTPVLSPRPFVARTSYINSCTGLSLSRPLVVELLRKMGLDASIPISGQEFKALNTTDLKIAEDDLIHVLVPPTRPDILHECDIMEDAAVAYGFNNLKKTFPNVNTIAKPFPPNKLSDTIRRLCSEAGWTEVLPLTLCSHDENFKFLNRKDPGDIAVVLANPKTIEYQIVRTSLLPGLLKTLRENRKHVLPIRIFEVSDVVIKDAREERQARNVRRVAGVFCGRKAGFEVVHGLVDRAMLGLGIANIVNSKDADAGYYIQACDDATYFPDRAAQIWYRPPLVAGAHITFAPAASMDKANAVASGPKAAAVEPQTALGTVKDAISSIIPAKPSSRDIVIGSIGILHPSVLKAYDLDYPASSFEFDVEQFL
ncbi:phenylalanyl-tRNA synthetase beta chain, partial [Phenoliferia sp. Uapishka_3]